VGGRVERRHAHLPQERSQRLDALLQRGLARAQVAAERDRHAHRWLFLPARRQHAAHAGDAAGPAAEQRPTQKVVQTIASLAFISLFVIPGLDHRFGWSAVPPAVVASGNALVAVGLWVVFMTFRENSYTSALIETAADQTVVTTGPYRVVRHPMYSGALVMMAGTALALASYWALASVGVLLAALVARLVDEERFLSATLPGYRAYVARTRARLVPFVW